MCSSIFVIERFMVTLTAKMWLLEGKTIIVYGKMKKVEAWEAISRLNYTCA